MTEGSPRISASTIRPRLLMEVLSEMVGAADWPFRQPRVELRSQGDEPEVFRLFGTAHPGTIGEVVRGELDIAMLNPSALLTMAHGGIGAYDAPQPVRAITVIPSYDQLGFAVAERTGLTSLDDIREQSYPLRVSVRGSHDPSTSLLVDVVLRAHGFSFADIESWGGEVHYHQPLPNSPQRLGGVEAGQFDAIFDEAIPVWADKVTGAGMRLLPIAEERQKALTTVGFRPGTIERENYPALPGDVPSLDFSGWPIFTRENAPDALIAGFCRALEARKDRIPWEMGDARNQPPLPLERMCRDTPEGPLDVPLHPAAEQVWQELGYLR